MSNFNTEEIVLFPYYVEGSAPLFRVGFDSFSGFAPRGWETDKNKAIALAQAFNEAVQKGKTMQPQSPEPDYKALWESRAIKAERRVEILMKALEESQDLINESILALKEAHDEKV